MAGTVKLCEICQRQPVSSDLNRGHHRQPHANAKYCTACRRERRRRPASGVTEAQGEQLRPLLGTLTQDEIARRVGISEAKLVRWLRENGLQSNARDYTPEVVEAVLREYEQAPKGEGRKRVTERFAGVKVRSVTERYKQFEPRQVRWTPEQVRQGVRMAGLVSHTAQARYFGRPNAYNGSIKSLWQKQLTAEPGNLNGFGVDRAWQLAQSGCPAVLVQRLETGAPIAKILWLDLARHLQPGLPDWVVDAVRALARFQAWLHGTDDPAQVRAMIMERESDNGDEHTGDDERARAAAAGRAGRYVQHEAHCADSGGPDGEGHRE